MRPLTDLDNWQAVARNLAQVLSFAADALEDGGLVEDAATLRTAYARQVDAHGLGG